MTDLTLLDQSVPKLLAAAAELPLEDLVSLIGAEQVGKTRKSAIDGLTALVAEKTGDAESVAEAIEEAVEEPEGEILENAGPLEPTISWENPNVVTNCQPGTTLHLGDGRKLAHGESAEVSADLAAFLRERGQAE